MTLGRLPRPRRAAMPIAASVAALGVWGAVAHDSGAGWVQAIGALGAGTLLVGMLAPAFAVLRARCRVVASPSDGAAGSAVVLQLDASAAVEIQPVDPPGPTVMAVPHSRTALGVRPERRGVLDHCTVVLASAAPFGILWWTRTVTLPLARPVAVGPRTGHEEVPPPVPRTDAQAPLGAADRGNEWRGVRPYAPGDRRTLAHWPATAHTGALMVREAERIAPRVAAIDGRLPTDPDAAERHAERVMATVRSLLLAGVRVELETVEPGGAVLAPVTTLEEAGRRLALALPRTGSSTGVGP